MERRGLYMSQFSKRVGRKDSIEMNGVNDNLQKLAKGTFEEGRGDSSAPKKCLVLKQEERT